MVSPAVVNIAPALIVVAVTLKMHEPKVITPVAVPLGVTMLKAGVVDVSVSVTVVVPVVPNSGTPLGKTKGRLASAAALAAVTGTVKLLLAYWRGAAGAGASDEPQATSNAAAHVANRPLSNMLGLGRRKTGMGVLTQIEMVDNREG